MLTGAGLSAFNLKAQVFFYFFFLRRSFALVTQAGGNGSISAHRNLRLMGSGNSPASASQPSFS